MQKMVFHWFLLLCLFSLARVCHGEDGFDHRLTKLIEDVESSVVRIDVSGNHGQGIGSGFLVTDDGLVVTNHHVIAGATEATITFIDGTEAEVLGTLFLDGPRDIAVLKIDGDSHKFLPLATKHPSKGTSVVAFGAPLGLSFSATEGIVSAIRTSEELKKYTANTAGTWVQTSTPISPGNSGGPLVDGKGQVVGANTMGMLSAQNLNFAISSVDIIEAVNASKTLSLVSLELGAAKIEVEVSLSQLVGEQQAKAIEAITELIMVADADSELAYISAARLIMVDPDDVSDSKVRRKVALAFKRMAYESDRAAELGIRGMSRWGGDFCIPYFVELLEIENFHGSEAIYAELSESKDPRAAEAIARRLGNFFDSRRAWAALRRMGATAEPGLILAVSSPNPDVCLGSIRLLAEKGTEASLNILDKAERKGTGIVRKEAKTAATKIRTRARRAALSKEEQQ